MKPMRSRKAIFLFVATMLLLIWLNRNPLFFVSIGNGQLWIARCLIAMGADLDRPDRQGVTPFHFALMNQEWDAADWLLNRGIDPLIPDHFGNTPLHTAYLRGDPRVYRRIMRCYLNASTEKRRDSWGVQNPVVIAIRMEMDIDTIAQLLERGYSPDIPESHGITPMMLAIQKGDLSLVELLLRYHVDLNRKQSYNLYTAIHYAVEKKNLQLVDLLLKAGADLHARDEGGRTPLMIAQECGAIDLVQRIDAFQKEHD